jgi:DNA-binding transcriptional MerR regulator
MDKDDGAFLTIGELARELGVAQHILRYWETRFPQLKPLQRSGNRRYYRPGDVDVARHIHRLLNDEGFTVRGAQRVLGGRGDARRDNVDRGRSLAGESIVAAPAALPSSTGTSVQGELPISAVPVAAPAKPDSGLPSQVGNSDLALLIARLTVIRQNLRDAIEPD